MRPILSIAAFLCGVVALAAPAADPVVVEPGNPGHAAMLGFGWGRAERSGGTTFNWIRRLEADVRVERPDPAQATVTVRAVPFFVPRRQQSIGLYVNNRFVKEWSCPHREAWRFEDYAATVPAEFWRSGTNRITLRMAYAGPHRDRKLSLAVSRIEVQAGP